MTYQELYLTPDGFDPLLLAGDGINLTRLDFIRVDPAAISGLSAPGTHLFLQSTREWLDAYFAGAALPCPPLYCLDGISPFGQHVMQHLLQIPFGDVTTYGKLANTIANETGVPKMSAQAVGGAVGRNPICIIIPCHRVVGSNGSLTGFGGGLKNKIALLRHEGIDITQYSIPVKGTKL